VKVAIVGDTHMPRFGRALPVALASGLRAERVELILHVGDFTDPAIPALFEEIAPLEAVAGNNDPPALVARFGRRKILEVGGARIGLIHGDGMRGTTVSRSVAAFADDAVDVISFGHSHQPLCERRDGVWLVNPGSPTDKRRQPRYSYAFLDIARSRVTARLEFYDDKRPE
jgi:putative phosphoesterase